MSGQLVHNRIAQQRDLKKDGRREKPIAPFAAGQGEPMNNAVESETVVSAQEQNPDLLHWRANVLLDEMMLGAVDIAADESSPARALPAATAQRPSTQANGAPPSPTVNRYSAQDASGDAVAEQYEWGERRVAAYNTYASPAVHRDDSTQFSGEQGAGAGLSRSTETPTPTVANRASNSRSATRKGANPSSSTPGNGTEQWLFAAEQRYEQLAVRRQSASAANATYDYDGWSTAPEYGVNTADQAISAAVPKYPAPAEAPSLVPLSAPSAAKNPTVRSKRSNLLPRMSAADARSVQQEMGMLQSAIEEVLPAGHESRERSQHLLQKAHAILQRDPSRSAEVDYYLQQVRTIVQRVQETAQWSDLYYSRLRTYLWGWLVLSVLVILGRYLYQGSLLIWMGSLGPAAGQSQFAYNLLTVLGAFFAGAMGGAIGALLNLYNHANLAHGFFDRKYGLRGLILPLIGAGVGLLLCLLFGIGYYLLGVEPADHLFLALLPALVALLFGAAQEYVYGVRS